MTTPVTTQQRHPWRAAARTALEVALALAALLIAVGPLLADFIEQFWPGSPAVPWIAAAVVFVSSLAALLARLAALPQVDALLERLKLGSSPAAATHDDTTPA